MQSVEPDTVVPLAAAAAAAMLCVSTSHSLPGHFQHAGKVPDPGSKFSQLILVRCTPSTFIARGLQLSLRPPFVLVDFRSMKFAHVRTGWVPE